MSWIKSRDSETRTILYLNISHLVAFEVLEDLTKIYLSTGVNFSIHDKFLGERLLSTIELDSITQGDL